MTTVPQAKHHQPLHNFSLPFLKWGQRLQSNHQFRRRHHHRTSPPSDSSDSDLTNRRRFRNYPEPKIDGNGTGSGKATDADVTTADDGDVKPWNLRPRRLPINAVDGNCNSNGAKSLRVLRGLAGAGADAAEENEEIGKKRRVWISLSKEEIEEDVYAFTGSRPVRRPRKRNRTAQKHVDNVFPGLYLVGVSAESYRV